MSLDLQHYFGSQLVQIFSTTFAESLQGVSSDWTDRTVTMVVAILLQELHYRDVMLQNDQLGLVVATYVSQWNHLSLAGEFAPKSWRLFDSNTHALLRKSQPGPGRLQSLSPILTIWF
jgi:hypothetical protein